MPASDGGIAKMLLLYLLLLLLLMLASYTKLFTRCKGDTHCTVGTLFLNDKLVSESKPLENRKVAILLLFVDNKELQSSSKLIIIIIYANISVDISYTD